MNREELLENIRSLCQRRIRQVVSYQDADLVDEILGEKIERVPTVGTYTVIVKGDIDGTGIINSTDYLQIKKAFLEEITLENEYLAAADTNGDGRINSTDYLQIKNYFLDQFDLYA